MRTSDQASSARHVDLDSTASTNSTIAISVEPFSAAEQDSDEGEPALSVELDLRNAIGVQGGTGKLVAGKLTLLGLSELRDELGPHWPGVASRIHALVEEEIETELLAEESFQIADEDIFVVRFDGSVDEAAKRARRIGARVTDRLNTELPSVLETVSVDTFVAEVDLALLSTSAGAVVPRLIAMLNRIRCEAQQLALRLKKVAFSQIRLKYLPTLNQSRSQVEFSRCTLDPHSESAATLYFRQIVDEATILRDLGELDALILTMSVEAMHKSALAEQSASLLIPVRITTLARRELRREYLRHVRAIPEPYRRAIVLDVIRGRVSFETPGCEAGLEEVGNYFRYTLRTRGDDLEQLSKRSGVWALSIDMLEAADKVGGTASKKIASVAQLANERGWNSLACSANSLGLVQLAADCGFTHVSGTAVHLATDVPRAPFRIRAAALSSNQGWLKRD